MQSFWNLLAQIGDFLRWWTVIAPWEAALRVRLGKHVTVLRAGAHLRIPYIDVVYRQSVRLRVVTLPTQTLGIDSAHALTVGGVISYAIADILRLYNTLHHVDSTIVNMAAQAVAAAVAADPKATTSSLEAVVARNLHLEQFGLTQVQVRITDFARVRTLRLMMDTRNYYSGDTLDTVSRSSP